MKRIAIFSIIVLFLLIIGCNSKPTALSIPNEFAYATKFITELNKGGVKVQEIKRSKFESFFKETDKAVYIATDKGIVDVVFFPNNDGNKIKIETVKEDSSQSQYGYNVSGKPINADGPIQANRPLYFTVHSNFYSVTDSKELDEAIKKTFNK